MTDDPTIGADDDIRRLDATEDAEYESTLRDVDGVIIDASALAVDASDATLDDSDIELTLGQDDDVLPGGAADPR